MSQMGPVWPSSQNKKLLSLTDVFEGTLVLLTKVVAPFCDVFECPNIWRE